MSRDYGARQSLGKKSKTANQLLLLGFGFLSGYITASFVKLETFSHWLNSQVLAYQDVKTEAKPHIAKKPHASHKPKFEFYTLLANEKAPTAQVSSHDESKQTKAQETSIAVSQAVSPNTKAPEATNPSKNPPILAVKTSLLAKDKSSFIIQVASFKARKDAEHMKALLTLKGYEVMVTPIVNPNGPWFRVLIGPFANRILADKAQLVLLKSERLNGMIRRV